MDYLALLALIVKGIEVGEAAVPQLIAAYKQLQADLSQDAGMTPAQWEAFDARVTQAYGTDAWKTDAELGK
jgi:hypothetical protein